MKLLKTYTHTRCNRLKIEHHKDMGKEFFYWFGAVPFIRGLKESPVLSDYSSHERYYEATRNV